MDNEGDIYGIAYLCPKLLRNDQCPLNEVDNLSFKEKVIWIEGLSEQKKESILKHHFVCSKSMRTGFLP